ncbi:periplasmic heavy metal sensor [candidate division WOR-3 bacterium]|uniref:Periplasmic heavy metal sensor n=1 Tax=candidate division WOR-3 bacterium TaxID=2052148 RepID=A0A937XJ37_UNCW3|nr:periplasmic heavy metal sensor [candidate division WOR-3 bacterium]
MKHSALVALMIAAVAGFALAQPGPAPADKSQVPMTCGMNCKQGMPGMKEMQGMMHGAAMPDMTPEQMEKMDALRTAQVKAMVPLRADLKVKEIELDALWRADEPDAKKIIAKVREIGDIREKMEVARINHQFDIRKLMTPEQRKAMNKMDVGPGMMGKGKRCGMRGMMRGPMGGEGCGMQGGSQCGGPQGPMGQGGQPGCKMQ